MIGVAHPSLRAFPPNTSQPLIEFRSVCVIARDVPYLPLSACTTAGDLNVLIRRSLSGAHTRAHQLLRRLKFRFSNQMVKGANENDSGRPAPMLAEGSARELRDPKRPTVGCANPTARVIKGVCSVRNRFRQRARSLEPLETKLTLPRAIMRRGDVFAIPQVGELHHCYDRQAA